MRIFHPIKDPILLTACIIASLLGSFLVLALMHKFLSMRAKGRLITALTFLAGFFYSLEFFLPAKDGKNFLTPWVEPVGDALAVIGAFAFPLGLISLAVVHLGNIRRRGGESSRIEVLKPIPPNRDRSIAFLSAAIE